MSNKSGYTPKELQSDTNNAIGDVIAAAQTLENIYSAEIKALQESNTKAFIDLGKNKITAAQDYYALVSQLIDRKEELKNADPAKKEELRKIYAIFTDTTRENIKMVNRLKRSSRRLGDTLRNAALKAAQKSNMAGYGKNGEAAKTSPRKIISSGLCEKA